MQTLKSEYSTCIGPSMHPTLRPGDGLKLHAYAGSDEIRVGDVIVYPHPCRPVDVVHRIIQITSAGVITRGDNNNLVDPYTVGFDDIIGKVLAAKRKNRLVGIRGGRVGWCIHKLMLARKYGLPVVLWLPGRASKLIAAAGIFKVFHPLLRLKILHLEKNQQTCCILMIGRKAIGKRPGADGAWQIRFPYKYFIDTRRLGKN